MPTSRPPRYYATVYERTPEGLPFHLGVSAEEAAFLQRIAWETVTDWQAGSDVLSPTMPELASTGVQVGDRLSQRPASRRQGDRRGRSGSPSRRPLGMPPRARWQTGRCAFAATFGRSRQGGVVAGLTSRDVARAAGVSQATVSNVLNRPRLVSGATLEKVRATMAAMGFVVNDSARSLRAGRSRTLGVITLDLANPFWGEVMRGIEAAATPNDYSVLFGSSDEQPEKERHFLRLFHQHRVHAVLVSSLEADSGALRALRERGTMIVLIDKRSTRWP